MAPPSIPALLFVNKTLLK